MGFWDDDKKNASKFFQKENDKVNRQIEENIGQLILEFCKSLPDAWRAFKSFCGHVKTAVFNFPKYHVVLKVVSIVVYAFIAVCLLGSIHSKLDSYVFGSLAVIVFFVELGLIGWWFETAGLDKDIKKVITKLELDGFLKLVASREVDNKLVCLFESELTAQEFEKQYKNKFEHHTGYDILKIERAQLRGRISVTFKVREVVRAAVSEAAGIKVPELESKKQVVFEPVVDSRVVINELFEWDFRKSPHALIVGMTGGGKTFFIAYLLLAFLRRDAEVMIGDPKNSGLSYLEKFLGDNVKTDVDGIIVLLERFECEMNKRYKEIRERPDYAFGKDYADYNYSPVWFILDEFVAFVSLLDKANKEKFEGALKRVVMKGREAGCFVLLATQRPDAKYLDASIRDLLGLRVALGSCSDDGYKMAFGSDGKGLKPQVDIKGSGYLYIDGSTTLPETFESPFMDVDFVQEFEKLATSGKKRIDGSGKGFLNSGEGVD